MSVFGRRSFARPSLHELTGVVLYPRVAFMSIALPALQF